jgi:hypothetical protein
MPAIQPARLKQQAALVVEHFADPPAFIRSLHHLLDFYADRAHRPGQAGKPGPLIESYKVRPPVLRQILQELIPLAQENPSAGLDLCDALWVEPYLELRLLAAMLLGQIPADPPETITRRVNAWLRTDLELQMIEAVLAYGFARLRQDDPQTIIKLIQNWMSGADAFHTQLGLHALRPLIEDRQFENLPAFFRLIQPLARQTPSGLRPDLLDVLIALAHRSPSETAYFLRQTLESPNAVDTAWLIRQTLAEFPPETQTSLRSALRSMDGRPTRARRTPK